MRLTIPTSFITPHSTVHATAPLALLCTTHPSSPPHMLTPLHPSPSPLTSHPTTRSIRTNLRLRTRRRGLAAWLSLRALQLVNLVVILVVLAVQAPWDFLSYATYSSFHGGGSCQATHIFGMRKVYSAKDSLALTRRGNLAEVLLFMLLRLLVNVRNSDLFGRIVRLSAELDMKREEARAREAEAWKAKQAAVAEATSKWRARRKRRVKELRAAVMKVAYTGNPNPQELQVSEACTAIC